MQAAIEAVAEVGNPTIVATLTVVAALLPMLFVSGLMGPYMAPIPANASAAMLFSFFVAMVIAPWLMLRLAPQGRRGAAEHERRMAKACSAGSTAASPRRSCARAASAWIFLIGVGVATLLVVRAVLSPRRVTVKLLPFDNKSELAVVVDLPEGATLEDTERTLFAAADDRAAAAGSHARSRPMPARRRRSTSTAWCGTIICASRPELGELQVNLAAARRAQARQPRHRARSARSG